MALCVHFGVSIAHSRAETWIDETGGGVGGGVCLSGLSCGPSSGAEQGGEPLICA